MRRLAAVLSLLAASGASAQPAAAPQDYAQRYAQLCAACHGADGRGEPGRAPALAGQPSFYAATQLFLFRAGRRTDEAMTAVGKALSDADLRGFSDLIGKLPAVRPAPPAEPTEPVDAARMAQGRTLAKTRQCMVCHGEDLGGGRQVPRLASQHEDYLARALHEFQAGKRLGYTTAMNEALAGIAPAELDTLAYFFARLPEQPGTAAPASR